ncbi:MAG TPA: ArsR family transcriptional regulator [Candidatus Syntrophoarchaeum butanivorans]|uniref:ArsR family transcriptional regulator n=1 Tax=Candidatus Syntropharchaeum butanivorans TaxID=1839936 RepID=A0A7C0X3Q5_9EURY|nr:ArsR family transcriptional regulator [Candidatus Syntrophoarchaeum butanivorans]
MSAIPPSYDVSSETLEKVRNLVSEDFEDLASLFKVLSDPKRLNILRALETESLCVCVFVEVLDCKYSALSYHLKLLKETGLVNFKRDGNFLIYRLTDLGRKVLEKVEEIRELL